MPNLRDMNGNEAAAGLLAIDVTGASPTIADGGGTPFLSDDVGGLPGG